MNKFKEFFLTTTFGWSNYKELARLILGKEPQ